jgi:hypothetical protein
MNSLPQNKIYISQRVTRWQPSRYDIHMDWNWGKGAQFRSDVVPHVCLDVFKQEVEYLFQKQGLRPPEGQRRPDITPHKRVFATNPIYVGRQHSDILSDLSFVGWTKRWNDICITLLCLVIFFCTYRVLLLLSHVFGYMYVEQKLLSRSQKSCFFHKSNFSAVSNFSFGTCFAEIKSLVV